MYSCIAIDLDQASALVVVTFTVQFVYEEFVYQD